MKEYIEILDSRVRDGLRNMLKEADSEDHLDTLLVNKKVFAIGDILWVIEIAKIAPDKPEWFPKGQWATIQNLQRKCTEEISTMFKEEKENEDGNRRM